MRNTYLIVILCLFASLLAPPTAQAQPALPCSWPLETSVDSLLNVAYPDTNAIYWTMPIDTARWRGMIITGRFPATRFMSFTSYDALGFAYRRAARLPDTGRHEQPQPVRPRQGACGRVRRRQR